MNSIQWLWLRAVAARIPGLFHDINSGSEKSSFVMGERVINNRVVRLSLVAQVVDPGANPLHSHASSNYPNTSTVVLPEGMKKPETKRRSAKKNGPW